MATYAQRAALYYLHLDLRYNMYYILFHINTIFFTYRTSFDTVLFRLQASAERLFYNTCSFQKSMYLCNDTEKL